MGNLPQTLPPCCLIDAICLAFKVLELVTSVLTLSSVKASLVKLALIDSASPSEAFMEHLLCTVLYSR